MKEYTGKKLVNPKTGYEYRIFNDTKNHKDCIYIIDTFKSLEQINKDYGNELYKYYTVVEDK